MKKSFLGIITVLSATVLFSSYSVFGKLLLNYFPSVSLVLVSQLFCIAAILVIYGFMPELKKILHLPKKEIIALIIIGVLSSAIAPLCLFKGLEITTATNSIIIGRLEAVFVGIISALWLKESITKHQILGMIIMFFGVIFITTQGFNVGLNLNVGDLLIITAALLYAGGTTIFKKYLHHISPELVVIVRNSIGAIFFLTLMPFILNQTHNFSSIIKIEALIPMLIFSIIVIVVAQSLWYKSLELIPASKASTISLSSPIFGVIFAVTILNESLAMFHLYGGILVVIGLILTIIHHQKHPHHHIHQKVKHWTH